VVLPATPAAIRLAEILEVLNAGDREAVLQYALENFTPGMLRPDADSIVDFLMMQYRTTGGYDIRRVLQSSEQQISVLVQSRHPDDRWARLVVGAEAQEPHRVQGLFTYGASAALVAESTGPVKPSEIPDRLAKLIDALTAAGDFSGTVCLSMDGTTVLSRAWGVADRQADIPNAPSTRFSIASLGKMFTAVATVQLVEAGRLRYDDRVSTYIPDWMAPGSETVTVEQLLTHTSGLGDYLEAAMRDSTGHYDTLADYKSIVRNDSPAFEPGSQFRYSNSGFLLLGVLIERITGEPWDHYVQNHVFEPAGMRRTSAYRSPDDASIATGYYRDAGGNWHRNDTLLVGRGTPAGGSASTSEDLVAFARALVDGRLVSRESLRRMTTARSDMGGTGMLYGYGFEVAHGQQPSMVYGHAGGFPGVSAFLEIHEGRGYVLAVLSNQSEGATEVANAWRDLLMRSSQSAGE